MRLPLTRNLRRLAIVGAILLAVLLVGTTGYHYIGHGRPTWFNCLYMTFTTITGVGYGEIIDLSNNVPGRVFTMAIIAIGMATVIYGAGLLVAFVVEGDLSGLIKEHKMSQSMANMKDHYIVCGAGTTGAHVIRELIATKRAVVVIEADAERLRQVPEALEVPHIIGDATDDEVLVAAGVRHAAGLVAALPEDKDNLFITVAARELNPNLRIIARAVELRSQDKLLYAGANCAVSPNFIGGLRMVSELVRPATVTFLDGMLRDRQTHVRIEDIHIEAGAALAGKSLTEAAIPAKLGALVLAIRHEGEERFDYNPHGATKLVAGATLIVMGDLPAIDKLRRMATASPRGR